jgi:hypothetical protein
MPSKFTPYVQGMFSAAVTRSNHVLDVGLGHGKSPCFLCSCSSTVAVLAYGRLFSAYLNIADILECA